jgi:hypothetical protein
MAYLGTQIYLGDVLIEAKGLYLGEFEALLNPTSSGDIITNGLAAWFNASTYPNSGSWNAYVGNATGSLSGTILPTWNSSNGGVFNFTTASKALFLSNTTSEFNLTSSLNYTIFVVGRQSGSASDFHGRMLVSPTGSNGSPNNNNWLLGTYGGGGTGGATKYNNALFPYNGLTGDFVITSGSIYDTDWRIHTELVNSNTAYYYLNGNFVTSSNSSPFTGPKDLSLNITYTFLNESNAMEIGDILVYTSSLSSIEIKAVSDIIGARYGL